MPNGGGDNCGTCWLYRANRGKPRYDPPYTSGSVCSIRGIAIEDPLYTYCVNHQLNSRRRVRQPVGPVYADYSLWPLLHMRTIIKDSPDTPDIRRMLLAHLRKIRLHDQKTGFSPIRFKDEVIKQLGAFREERAVPTLKRLVAVETLSWIRAGGEAPIPSNDFFRSLAMAVESLAAIVGDRAVLEIDQLWDVGRRISEKIRTTGAGAITNDMAHQITTAVQLSALLALRHCTSATATDVVSQWRHHRAADFSGMPPEVQSTSDEQLPTAFWHSLSNSWNQVPAHSWHEFPEWWREGLFCGKRSTAVDSNDDSLEELPVTEEEESP